MYGVPASRALVSVLDGAQRRGDGVRPTPGLEETGPGRLSSRMFLIQFEPSVSLASSP